MPRTTFVCLLVGFVAPFLTPVYVHAYAATQLATAEAGFSNKSSLGDPSTASDNIEGTHDRALGLPYTGVVNGAFPYGGDSHAFVDGAASPFDPNGGSSALAIGQSIIPITFTQPTTVYVLGSVFAYRSPGSDQTTAAASAKLGTTGLASTNIWGTALPQYSYAAVNTSVVLPAGTHDLYFDSAARGYSGKVPGSSPPVYYDTQSYYSLANARVLTSLQPFTAGVAQELPEDLPDINGIIEAIAVASGAWVTSPLRPAIHYAASGGTIFTGVSDFPIGFADRFEVRVAGISLGEYSPSQAIQFSDHAPELGNLLVSGVGVAEFDIRMVDSFTPEGLTPNFALPVSFNSPTGSYIASVPEPAAASALLLLLSPAMRCRRVWNPAGC
jgi:hypothetical protein